MAAEAVREQGRSAWVGRPRAAAALRFLAWMVPIALSVAATNVASRIVPRPSAAVGAVVWWVLLGVVAVSTLYLADKVARRILPLAALLQLSLVFPDQAPSRFGAALRTGTVAELTQRVADIKANGLADDQVRAAEELIELIAALSVHDRLTRGHAERVRAYSRMIGEELGLGADDLDRLQWAGLLHDVGKLFVPGEILNKPSRLTDEEFAVIKTHPALGAALCEPLRDWLGDWVDAVGQHHEHWDGRGYPEGLAGEGISLAARIVAVADVFDVITSVRSYKAADGAEAGREELTRCAGTQFDPQVVRAFLSVSLGRLRLVMGPLSWLANLPMVGNVPIGPLAGTAFSAVTTAAALAVGGLVDLPATPAASVAAAAPAAAPAAPEEPPGAAALVVTPTPEEGLPAPTPSPAPVPAPAPAPRRVVGSTTTTTSTPRQLLATGGASVAGPALPTDPEPTVPTTTPTTAPVPPTTVPWTTSLDVHDDVAPPTLEDEAVVIDVLANDGSADAITWAGTPGWGTATVVGDRIRFLPPPDRSGTTTFTYGATGDSADAVGTVTVTVVPVNDAPGFTPGADVVVDEDAGPQVVAGWASAVSAGPADEAAQVVQLSAVVADPGLFEEVPVVDADGSLRFTPAHDAHGSTTVAVTATDDGGTADGGVDSSATHTLTITVLPVNDVPVVADQVATVLEDGTVSLAVLEGAVDADGDALVVAGATSADGAASTDGTSVTYAPAPDSNGVHVLRWTVEDGNGGTATGTGTVTVVAVNDAPGFAAGADVVVDEDAGPQVVAGWASAVSAGPADEAGQVVALSAVVAAPGLFEEVPAVDADGTLRFTPAHDAHGSTTVVVTATDDGGTAGGGADASAPHTLTITVRPVNDAVVAVADAYTTQESTALVVAAPGVLANDADEDGDPLTASVVRGSGSGTLVLGADGSFRYEPAPGFVGTDSFTYRASDGTTSSTATVSVLVSSSTVTGTWYLGSTGRSADDWDLTATAPPSVGAAEPDRDADGNPGLTVLESSQKLTSTDGRDYQHWDLLPTSPLVMEGPAKLVLWSAARAFDLWSAVDYSIWLQDCAANGSGCTTLASSLDIHVARWNSAPGFVRREITIGSVDHTVAPGRMLRLRVMFNHHDVWIATSGERPSALLLTQPSSGGGGGGGGGGDDDDD